MWIAVGATIIGLTLGLLGSGGSSITVPVLVYLLDHSPKQSMAESMAIVGIICAIAAIPYGRAKLIDWYSVWYFGIPGMIGTFIGAWLGGLATDAFQLVVFGIVLVAAAISMFRKSPEDRLSVSDPASDLPKQQGTLERQHRSPIWKITLEGIIVGIVTGFVGVGGGFLIVPALVIFGKLPMRKAIATSLVIIALKSVVGFFKWEHYLRSQNMSVDLTTIALFTAIGIAGSLVGQKVNARMNQRLLKFVFAVFLMLLGGWIVLSEGSKLWTKTSEKTGIRKPRPDIDWVAARGSAGMVDFKTDSNSLEVPK